MHRLKTTLRVAGGVAEQVDSNEKLKLFDIIIETPIRLLSCQCESTYTHLPTYTKFADQTPPAQMSDERSPTGPNTGTRHHHRASSTGRQVTVPSIGSTARGAGGTHLRPPGQTGGHSHANMLSFVPHMRPSTSVDERHGATAENSSRSTVDAIQRSELFARLVAGEESEAGEQPPAYSS